MGKCVVFPMRFAIFLSEKGRFSLSTQLSSEPISDRTEYLGTYILRGK